MAQQKGSGRVYQTVPWLLPLLLLSPLSWQFELQEEDWPLLRSDLRTLHSLEGLAERTTYGKEEAGEMERVESRASSQSYIGDRARRNAAGLGNRFLKQPMSLLDDLKGCQNYAQCLSDHNQDFNEFLREIERQRATDTLLSASEVSSSYYLKVLLMLDEETETYRKAMEEYSLDPDWSVLVNPACLANDTCLPIADLYTLVKVIGKTNNPDHSLSGYTGSKLAKLLLRPAFRNAGLYSLGNSTVPALRSYLLNDLKLHGRDAVVETEGNNKVFYHTLDRDGCPTKLYKSKTATDPNTRYDKQHIVMLEDDTVAREAAQFLFEKHPTVSTLYVLENGLPKRIKGQLGSLTEDSRLVLVGHGRKNGVSGETRLGGYGAQDIAEIVSRVPREGVQIKTVSVVGCDVGKDQTFVDALLRELRTRQVETELHLRSSLVEVRHSGEKVTAELTPLGLEYRLKDASKKVVAKLDREGRTITIEEPGERGRVVYSDKRNFLMNQAKDQKQLQNWENFKIEWPNRPLKFVDQNMRMESTDVLEGLAWAFFKDVKGRAPLAVYDLRNEHYVLKESEMSSWLKNNEIEEVLKHCRKINTAEDLVKEIHHNARIGETENTYYNLQDWIYQVNPRNLYVYLVGKKLRTEVDTEQVKRLLENQIQAVNNQIPPINWEEVRKASNLETVKSLLRSHFSKTKFKVVKDILNKNSIFKVDVKNKEEVKNIIDGHKDKEKYPDIRGNIKEQDLLMPVSEIGRIESVIQKCVVNQRRLQMNKQANRGKTVKEFLHQQYPYRYNKIRNEVNMEDYVRYIKDTLQGGYQSGLHSLEKESWLGRYFMASVFAESARNFRTFPVILMALDGYQNGQNHEFITFLFDEHPMARGGTWVDSSRRGFWGSSRTEKSSKLYNMINRKTERELQMDLSNLILRENKIYTKWLAQNQGQEEFNSLLESLNQAYRDKQKETIRTSYEEFKDIINRDPQDSMSSGHFLGGADDGVVTAHDLLSASGTEHSLELSAYHSRAKVVLSRQIHEKLQVHFRGERAGEYSVDPKSVRVEEGQFRCQLISQKSPGRNLEWAVKLNTEGLKHMEKVLEMIQEVGSTEISERGNPLHVSEHLERTGKAVAVVGLMLGLQGAIRSFEEGDVEHGSVTALQTVHGVTAMTAAAMGNLAKSTNALTNRPIQVMVKLVSNPVSKRALVAIPVVGIGIGIYNIKEDLKRKDTLGYIDAALDATIVALDVVEMGAPVLVPVLVPVNLALSVVRMAFDDVYLDVQTELAKLPKDAGFLQKLGAALKGLGMGILHFEMDVASFFYTIPYREIEEGHHLVEQISDYHRYYTVQVEKGGKRAIDFAGAEDSWNAGNITFHLFDNGSSQFCLDKFISSKSKFGKQCWELQTDGKIQDIVLGMGESHHLKYSHIQRKVLLFIPAGSTTVVSGYEVESHTRFGTYYGNQKANNFFTVQEAKDEKIPKLMLSYYYQLYGENGDDIFFLGPQRSYVEGRAGRDTYIIPASGGNTIINNSDPEKTEDMLMIKVPYEKISVSRSGKHIILSFLGSHHVKVLEWFSGEEYRHMKMVSGDGVLFDVSILAIATPHLVARGVNKMQEKSGQVVDTTHSLLGNVTNIVGSAYSDKLIGNKQNNLIAGGGGKDYMKGGEGEDTYVVQKREGMSVKIDNFSTDNKTDLLLVEAELHNLRAAVLRDDLVLLFSPWPTSSFVTLLNWFHSEQHRHLLIVTQDFVTLTVSEKKTSCWYPRNQFQSECLLSQNMDYSKSNIPLLVDLDSDMALQGVTEVHGSNFNDRIKGNAKDNVITPGRGQDFLSGGRGADKYIITVKQGLKTIDNFSPNGVTDELFLREGYLNIDAQCRNKDMVLSVNKINTVILKQWFESSSFRHLHVYTADGFRFTLTDNVSDCGQHFLKIPLSLDFRQRKGGAMINMSNGEFSAVVEMYGSLGYDKMIGNGQDNILDPGPGGAWMQGGEGADTYMLKPGYDGKFEIFNFALDQREDTVMLPVDFLSGTDSIWADFLDLVVNWRVQGKDLSIRLIKYGAGPSYQHLSFHTSNGVLFRFSYLSGYTSSLRPEPQIVAYKVDLQGKQEEQQWDLSSDPRLFSVETVQGSLSHSNHIHGNKRQNVLLGGGGDDALDGAEGDDTLVGGQGKDILMGGEGDDTVYGEEGDDYLVGDGGHDVLVPGPGKDMVDGGPGRDTVLYQGDPETGRGVYVNLLSGEGRGGDAEGDVLRDVENVIGSIYSDLLVSGYEGSLLKGKAGNDVLVSLGGGDYLIGGEGSDIYLLDPVSGLVTIDNCAKDNATDIVYLRSLSSQAVNCQIQTHGIVLTLQGPHAPNTEVVLPTWNNHPSCHHLQVLFREGPVTMEMLLHKCQAIL